MVPQQALQLVDQAIGQLSANRDTHIQLQAAINTLQSCLLELEQLRGAAAAKTPKDKAPEENTGKEEPSAEKPNDQPKGADADGEQPPATPPEA